MFLDAAAGRSSRRFFDDALYYTAYFLPQETTRTSYYYIHINIRAVTEIAMSYCKSQTTNYGYRSHVLMYNVCKQQSCNLMLSTPSERLRWAQRSHAGMTILPACRDNDILYATACAYD